MPVQFRSLPILFFLIFSCQLLPTKKFKLATYTPPNGVKIGPGLYLDMSEMSNIGWLEFMYFAREDSISPEMFNLLLPDSTTWNRAVFDSTFILNEHCRIVRDKPKFDSINELRYLEHYVRYPGFRYYPVVGITPEQAAIYSIWRSSVVDQILNKELVGSKQIYRIIHSYRLPYASEFDSVLNHNPIKSGNKFFIRGICDPIRATLNYNKALKANVLNKVIWNDTTVIYPVHPFLDLVVSNQSGRFSNLIGNAAELTADGRSSWGWSAFDLVEPFQFHDCIPFKGPDHKTGFRNLCQVSVVAASTYKPVKWYQNPEVKRLFDILKNEKRRASYVLDSTKKANNYQDIKRLYESYFSSYKIISSPVFFENQKLEHGKPILLPDGGWRKPIFLQMPELKENGRIEVRWGHGEGNSWPLRKDSLNRYSVPLDLRNGNMILLFLEDSEKKTTSWFWIPYDLKNMPDKKKYWPVGR